MSITDLFDRLTADPDDEQPVSQVPDDLSSLDGDALPADPKPARRKAKRSFAAPAAKASAAQKRQVRDALTLLVTIPTGVWAMRDPRCGAAAVEQRDAIIDALVPIVCRNANMLRWFTASEAPWLEYLALLTACQPVASAVWGHHVRHQDMPDAGGGVPYDLSQYSAA